MERRVVDVFHEFVFDELCAWHEGCACDGVGGARRSLQGYVAVVEVGSGG